MARLATLYDFEEGGLYTSYQDYPFFARYVAFIQGRWPAGNILIAGCGWGFTVRRLYEAGRDVWGAELAQYCIDKAQRLLPVEVYRRIIAVDATNGLALRTIKSAAGMRVNEKFGLVVTENVLPFCSSDGEAAQWASVAGNNGQSVLHILTTIKPGTFWDPVVPNPDRDQSMLWRTLLEWKAIVGASDIVLDDETWEWV